MIKVLVIDDESPARMRVQQLLRAHPQLERVGEADCGEKAIALIESLRPEVLFLDIQLPDMSGFDVLSRLSYQPLVIFTTAYAQYAIRAFETYSIDYLVKPLEAERFQKAIEKLEKMRSGTTLPDFTKIQNLLQQFQSTPQPFSLAIKKRDRIILVDFEDISHFKAEDKYALAILQNGTRHLVSKSIGQLETELPATFLRVHRSYIINRSYLYEIGKFFKGKLVLKLKDQAQSEIITGETYTAKVKASLGL